MESAGVACDAWAGDLRRAGVGGDRPVRGQQHTWHEVGQPVQGGQAASRPSSARFTQPTS